MIKVEVTPVLSFVLFLQHLANDCWIDCVRAGAEVLAGNEALTHLQGIIVGRGN